ncbi:hypothetical protein QJQ45_019243 [Haematococcus lacustris]|nr:hypothetical protein QJQ45_019243 [Haematococcus lacustris]
MVVIHSCVSDRPLRRLLRRTFVAVVLYSEMQAVRCSPRTLHGHRCRPHARTCRVAAAAIKLFTNPGSRGKMSEWALAELGLDYEPITVDMRSGQHKTAEYLKINPFGKVPALVDEGMPLFESGAIVLHLANKYGKLPPNELAVAAQWVLWANSTLSEAFFVKGPTPGGAALLSVLNDILTTKPYLAGGCRSAPTNFTSTAAAAAAAAEAAAAEAAAAAGWGAELCALALSALSLLAEQPPACLLAMPLLLSTGDSFGAADIVVASYLIYIPMAFRTLRQQLDNGLIDNMEVDAGRFLAAAAAAKAAAASDPGQRYIQLLELQGTAGPVELRLATQLLPLLGSTSSWLSVEEGAALLHKEQCNSYGILSADQPHPHPPTAAIPAVGPSPHQAAASGTQAGPPEDGEGEEEEAFTRPLRGSALYGLASLLNHECNPNVARFDNFDAPGQQNTLMVFKAMHDLPAGTEVLQSYCPIGWDYADRQAHCREVYGFTCSCQRCQLEASWDDGGAAPTIDMQAESDEQWETTEGSETELGPGDVDMADVQQSCPASQPGASALQPDKQALQQAATQRVHQQPGAVHQAVALHAGAGGGAAALRPVGPAPAGSEAEGGPLEATYLQLYLLKFVCPRPHCLGTMAPTDVGSSLMACAVCGCQRSEQAFLADLDAASHK